jgi:F-type H+-transporting ATPase subunit epsilon
MHVSLVSPEERVWEGEAEMVVARSPEGEFAILRGHIPFLAALVPGVVKITSEGSQDVFLVTGGVLEASGPMDDYHVIVLADDAVPGGEVDFEDAKRRLMRSRGEDEDLDSMAEAELRVAIARVEIEEQQSLG